MAVWSEVRLSECGTSIRIDAEYYQPFFIEWIKRWHEQGVVPLGNHYARIMKRRFLPEDGKSFDYIEISRVSTILGTYDVIHLDDTEAPSRAQYVVKPGDVILSEVRPNRSAVSLFPEGIGRTVCSSGFGVLKAERVSPEYLFAYLKTSIITRLLDRETTATMYPAVADKDVLALPFPQPSADMEKRVTADIQKAFGKVEESKGLYSKAEHILIEELGLKELDLSPTLYYEGRFAKIREARRIDAEYFQPKYERVMAALKRSKPKRIVRLGELLVMLTNGHTPLHHNLSEGDVPFLTAEHVFDFRIEYDSEKRILLQHHTGELKRTCLKDGDCLITIKGRIGNAAIAENVPGHVNINQDIALFRLNEIVPSYYLMGYLNSPVGKTFIEQYCTGQINPFLGLGNVRLLPVPVYEEKRMSVIAEKTKSIVIEAAAALEQSRQILKNAIHMVEDGVLKGAN